MDKVDFPLRTAARPFYHRVLSSLMRARIPYLVGGAFALEHYTGIVRDTKDLDIFMNRADQERAMRLFESEGERIEWTAPHWLTKICNQNQFVDLIFGLANGVGQVTPDWWMKAPFGETVGVHVQYVPLEELIYSKAFIMERDRFDGADINHLFRAQGDRLDWDRLVSLFSGHWRVLLCHMILFGYVFPHERNKIPSTRLFELVERLTKEEPPKPGQEKLCRGTLLSRTQYREDIAEGRLEDARLHPHGPLNAQQAAQ